MLLRDMALHLLFEFNLRLYGWCAMTDRLLIDRELLERCALLLTDSLYPPDGCSDFDDWTAQGNDLAEELRAILTTPRQPEGEGLEVVAWFDTKNKGYLTDDKDRASTWVHEGFSVGQLCRLSDAQRAIAELRSEVAKWEKCHKEIHAPALNDAHAMIAELREECERLRMQLVACGVVALANTPESAAQARQMHPDYMSASCSDVADAVDREMTLRQQLAELRDMLSGEVETNIPLRQKAFDLTEQRDTLVGLLLDLWEYTHEPELEQRIEAALAEVK